MPSISLAIIDGTGDWGDLAYAHSMEHGFCKQLDSPQGAFATFYQRGPWALGLEDLVYKHKVSTWIEDRLKADASTRVMLAGYSRGAATILAVAAKLHKENTPVDSMFLFDAVSRQIMNDDTKIVPSVKFCRHAVRSDDADLVSKYETYIVKDFPIGMKSVPDPVRTNKMRPWFGHVALEAPKEVDFKMSRFRGSHGALGGVGWKDVPEDAPAQHSIVAWMNPFLKERGVPVGLIAYPPSSG